MYIVSMMSDGYNNSENQKPLIQRVDEILPMFDHYISQLQCFDYTVNISNNNLGNIYTITINRFYKEEGFWANLFSEHENLYYERNVEKFDVFLPEQYEKAIDVFTRLLGYHSNCWKKYTELT